MNRAIISARKLLQAAVLAVILLSGSSYAPTVLADPERPTARDHQITRTVQTLVRRDHLTHRRLDDEVAERCLKTYLKSLDAWKIYFLQSDIDQFRAKQHELDDLAKRDQKAFLDFAHTVFTTLLARIDHRAASLDELLAAEHDFTVEEEIIRDPDATRFPANEAEASERWRKRIKFDLLSLKANDQVEGEEAIEKLRRRYHSYHRRMHQFDGDELLEIYLTSLTTAFDPHTTYMSPGTLENFSIIMRLRLEGIGAALQSIEGETVIKKIIPGGAADRDGRLKVEDKIAGVGQGPDGSIEDVVDMKLSDVVSRIRGKRGTIVRLQVVSPGSGERKIIAITRAKIELKDSEARAQIFPVGEKPGGQPYQIGVIELPSFYMDMEGARRGVPNFKSTTRDVRKILKNFNEKKVDAVVLDLRRNGGGSLQEAISLTGLFLDEGPVVQVKDADGLVQPYHDLEPGYVWSGPLVVLISKFSASASEILAGAVQDYGRGLIVGDHATHGKGTVQSLMDLGMRLFDVPNTGNYGALKITMQQFYRPNGESTQNRGVLADVELPSLTTHLDVAEADLDYPIAFDQVKAQRFRKLSYVDKTMRDRLSYNSRERRKQSEDFQRDLEQIDRYLERKERTTVTLNEAKFMAEVKSLNTDKEEKETIEEMNDSADEGIELTYYLKEALNITVDYLRFVLVAQAK